MQQVHISVSDIQLKLHRWLLDHHASSQNKAHNSYLQLSRIMPLIVLQANSGNSYLLLLPTYITVAFLAGVVKVKYTVAVNLSKVCTQSFQIGLNYWVHIVCVGRL